MKRYLKSIVLFSFTTFIFSPIQVSAVTITPSSAALGQSCTASGASSTALGDGTIASGYCSTAMGRFSEARELASTAMGSSTIASGDFSIAIGVETTARGEASIAIGSSLHAGGSNSIVIGMGNDDIERLINSIPESFMVGFMTSSTDTTPEFFVKDGAVGVGTTSPKNQLDLGNSVGKKLAVFQKPTGEDFYGFGISSATLEIYAGATSGDNDPAMVVKKPSGNVGIGTSSPNFLLEVDGSAAKPDGGSWSNSSDERLKDITGRYNVGLDQIANLNPVSFYYKEGNPRGLPTDKEYIGFIAQEVQNVFPEAVSEGSDGYLDFNIHPVNVAVINGMKELKAENNTLKAENAMLKRDIEKIKAILGI